MAASARGGRMGRESARADPLAVLSRALRANTRAMARMRAPPATVADAVAICRAAEAAVLDDDLMRMHDVEVSSSGDRRWATMRMPLDGSSATIMAIDRPADAGPRTRAGDIPLSDHPVPVADLVDGLRGEAASDRWTDAAARLIAGRVAARPAEIADLLAALSRRTDGWGDRLASSLCAIADADRRAVPATIAGRIVAAGSADRRALDPVLDADIEDGDPRHGAIVAAIIGHADTGIRRAVLAPIVPSLDVASRKAFASGVWTADDVERHARSQEARAAIAAHGCFPSSGHEAMEAIDGLVGKMDGGRSLTAVIRRRAADPTDAGMDGARAGALLWTSGGSTTATVAAGVAGDLTGPERLPDLVRGMPHTALYGGFPGDAVLEPRFRMMTGLLRSGDGSAAPAVADACLAAIDRADAVAGASWTPHPEAVRFLKAVDDPRIDAALVRVATASAARGAMPAAAVRDDLCALLRRTPVARPAMADALVAGHWADDRTYGDLATMVWSAMSDRSDRIAFVGRCLDVVGGTPDDEAAASRMSWTAAAMHAAFDGDPAAPFLARFLPPPSRTSPDPDAPHVVRRSAAAVRGHPLEGRILAAVAGCGTEAVRALALVAGSEP